MIWLGRRNYDWGTHARRAFFFEQLIYRKDSAQFTHRKYMPTESDVRLEIAHVLFIDIVGYSKLLINEQRESLQELNQIVRGTDAFRTAEAAGQLTRIPTGDGMALVFSTTPEAPVQCALEIAKALKSRPDLRVRMGIHSGPVSAVTDVNDRSNIAGGGINTAQRVMDCGDAGHILLSKRVADDLAQYRQWRPLLHELGESKVKHDVTVSVVNLYNDEIGNPALPSRFTDPAFQPEIAVAPRRFETRSRRAAPAWLIALCALVGLAIIAVIFTPAIMRSLRKTPAAVSATPNPPVAAPPAPSAPGIPEKSIAVLPFENLSSDKENAFFAQGIQDEIITTLSKISGLRVISRTSTKQYESAPANLREIARDLRVANILEGSVQKAGDRVHINVQLIQADTDAHLWAQSYDRQLVDIFGVEGEVAKSIADSLRATLSPQEKVRVETKPTTNADAYVLYLRARDYQTRPDNFLQDFQSAARLYEQAIALDPNFALAHARLSAVTSNIYHWYEPTAELKQKARAEADESLRLQPDLGEGHAALGLYLYYGEADYEAALRELNLATKALPNDGDVVLYIAAVQRRQGRFKDAIAAYERAETVDPRNSVALYDASQTYFALRDWPTAIKRMDRVLALAPDSLNVKIQRAYIEFFWKGTTLPIKAALESIPASLDPDGVVTFTRWDVALMDRDPNAAERALASSRLEAFVSPNGVPLPKSYLRGCIALVRNDPARARAEFQSASQSLEQIVAKSPQDAIRHGQLGLLYALMGRKEDALREGRHAVELRHTSPDIVEGAIVQSFLTLIHARNGDADQAIPQIEQLLTAPFAVDYCDDSITLADLKTRWEWDPLRGDPRFQKILAGPEPRTIRK
jgi:TolB-like protein/class 3 adenylate cyclase/Tfp pilus assembly protein PilF